MSEELQIRLFGEPSLPTLVYLPGLHGDSTMIPAFRAALNDRIRFVEITYPRTLTWNISDYARAIGEKLCDSGITHGWLLAESFGSQPAWELINLSDAATTSAPPQKHFQVEGLILAAGFVKHPWQRGPGFLQCLGRRTPTAARKAIFRIQAACIRLQHGRVPGAVAGAEEFLARRTPLDIQAMRERLALLNDYDPRPIARRTAIPVHYLAGCVDPLVPWPIIRSWLRKHCPGYRGGKTMWFSHHNVLLCAARSCAKQVVIWMFAASDSRVKIR